MISDEKLLLSVQATSNNFSAAGYVALYKISEVIYSVRYEDDERCISVDIDCVSTGNTKRTILFQEPLQTEYSFYVPDEHQYNLFLKVQKECQDICTHYLEIATRLRDVYYSGVYSSLNQNSSTSSLPNNMSNPPFHLHQELEGLQAQSAFDFLEAIKNRDSNSLKLPHSSPLPTNDVMKGLKGGSTTPRSTASGASSVRSDTNTSNDYKCFYCKNEYENLGLTNDLYIHPYVPIKFDGLPVLMCITCLQNWKEYRDTAQYENELILPGEINEEICCLCSDSPETLTLCSSCPRSYCNTCLLKILNKKEYTKRIQNSDPNWKCMACMNQVPRQPVLSRDTWRVWTGVKKANTPGKGNSASATPIKKGMTSASSTPRSLKSQAEPQSEDDEDNDDEDDDDEEDMKSEDDEEIVVKTEITEIQEKPVHHDGDDVNTDDQMSVETSPANISHLSATNTNNKRKLGETDLTSEVVQETEDALKSISDVKTNIFKQSETYIKNEESHETPNKTLGDDTSKTVKKEQQQRTRRSNSGKASKEVTNTPNSSSKTKNSTSSAKSKTSTTPASASNTQSIECYYFQQYLEYQDQLYSDIHTLLSSSTTTTTKGKGSKKPEIVTDDVCFLCKDGGNVVECDYTMTTGGGSSSSNARSSASSKIYKRCLKVYHEDCLGFKIPDEVEKWCCPRHYCSCCGTDQIKYFCIFCPNSICIKCPEAFVQRVSIFLRFFPCFLI